MKRKKIRSRSDPKVVVQREPSEAVYERSVNLKSMLVLGPARILTETLLASLFLSFGVSMRPQWPRGMSPLYA